MSALMPSPVWAVGSIDRYAGCLWKAAGHSSEGLRWPSRHVRLYEVAEQETCD